MKKFFDYTTLAVALAITSGLALHFEAGREVGLLLKNVVHKFAPWINVVAFS
jgi:hypothetical protein